MLILISPAKTMHEKRIHAPKQLPLFLFQSEMIQKALQTYSSDDIKKLMKVNDKIAALTYERIHNMRFDMQGYSALDTYDGIQFKAMDPATLDESSWHYVCDHLRILSGFYGMVKPDDSIYPYRLEMQTLLEVNGCKQLYAFWMDTMAQALCKEASAQIEPYIINLASKEYDRSVRQYIMDGTWVDVIFYERVKQKLVTRATQAKKARGLMVRYMAEQKIEHLEEIKTFHLDGYVYHDELSNQNTIVFVKEG